MRRLTVHCLVSLGDSQTSRSCVCVGWVGGQGESEAREVYCKRTVGDCQLMCVVC